MLTNDFPSFNLFALSLVFNSVNLSKNKVFHLPWKILLRITKLQKNSDNSTVWTVKSCTLNSIYAFNFFRIQASGPCSSLIIITLSMTSPCWWEKNNTTFKLIIMKQIHWILLLLRKYSFNILVTTTSQNMLEKNNNKQTKNIIQDKKQNNALLLRLSFGALCLPSAAFVSAIRIVFTAIRAAFMPMYRV